MQGHKQDSRPRQAPGMLPSRAGQGRVCPQVWKQVRAWSGCWGHKLSSEV